MLGFLLLGFAGAGGRSCLSLTGVAFADAPQSWQLGFQDAATPIAQGLQELHHEIGVFLIGIVAFVTWMLLRAVWHFHESKSPFPSKMIHGSTIEIVWTLMPSLILMTLALPSFALLYSMDEIVDPAITVKAIGHQWYWSYEYSDYITQQTEGESVAFDSYMVPQDELEQGDFRLLEVDNRLVLPIQTHVRVLTTGADVIHSWAVPSLGVKSDALPGRLNQASVFIEREGVYYGQCSELCGAQHAFMPIVVEGVSLSDYLAWISEKLEEV